MTTVVFADLVGSTSMFESFGDAVASRFVTQLTSVLSHIFEQHHGRVVKLLGDGLLVVFASEGDAIAACVSIQIRLKDVRPGGSAAAPVKFQMGIDAGEVVEIEGDCFGDTVNSAARLADLAGAAQILTTRSVWSALLPPQRAALRSMGPMYLRGRSEATHVYRVEWESGRDEDATMARRSMFSDLRPEHLELAFAGLTMQLQEKGNPVSIGRAADATVSLNDPRVSRMHATLQWRGGYFILTDASSFGTWVYVGNQSEAIVLRRTECVQVGNGLIVAGCARDEDKAPLIAYSIKS